MDNQAWKGEAASITEENMAGSHNLRKRMAIMAIATFVGSPFGGGYRRRVAAVMTKASFYIYKKNAANKSAYGSDNIMARSQHVWQSDDSEGYQNYS